MRFLGTSRIILIKGSIYKNAHTHCKPLTFHAWLIKHDVSFRLFSLLFCYIIVTSKQKRILLFFGRVNKREEHRPQTETTEPTMLTKINWVILMTLLFLNFSQAKNSVSPKKTGMSPRKLLTGTECPPKVKSYVDQTLQTRNLKLISPYLDFGLLLTANIAWIIKALSFGPNTTNLFDCVNHWTL